MPFYAGGAKLDDYFFTDYNIVDQYLYGYLYGYGDNTYGQIGDNTATKRSSPVQTIVGGSTWKSFDVGARHAAGVKSDGTLWLWGINTYGQLGDNSVTNRSSPVQTVTGGTNWRTVACGGRNTAAVKTDGTLWVWGDNGYGQVGDNTVVRRSSPVQTVAGGVNWQKLSVGAQHMMAFKADGSLWGWGGNAYGQVQGLSIGISSPTLVSVGGVWKEVSCGGSYTAGIKVYGTLWCWGYSEQGQFGNNNGYNFGGPLQEVTGSVWTSVSASKNINYFDLTASTAAVKSDGSLWAWGLNDSGQLGDNTTVNKSSPVQVVAGGNNWKLVSCGLKHMSAIKTDGTLWAWGINTDGCLGDNTSVSKSSPIQITSIGVNWKETLCGNNLTMSITID